MSLFNEISDEYLLNIRRCYLSFRLLDLKHLRLVYGYTQVNSSNIYIYIKNQNVSGAELREKIAECFELVRAGA